MVAIYILIKNPEQTFTVIFHKINSERMVHDKQWVVTEDIEYGSWQIVNFEVLLWRTGLITSDSHYYCYLEVICSIASKVDRCCCCDSGESNINELFVFKDTWDTPAVSPLAAWCSSSSRYVIQLNYDFIFVFFSGNQIASIWDYSVITSVTFLYVSSLPAAYDYVLTLR